MQAGDVRHFANQHRLRWLRDLSYALDEFAEALDDADDGDHRACEKPDNWPRVLSDTDRRILASACERLYGLMDRIVAADMTKPQGAL